MGRFSLLLLLLLEGTLIPLPLLLLMLLPLLGLYLLLHPLLPGGFGLFVAHTSL